MSPPQTLTTSALRRTWVDRLPRREDVVSGDPDALISLDWSQDWQPGPLVTKDATMLANCKVACWEV